MSEPEYYVLAFLSFALPLYALAWVALQFKAAAQAGASQHASQETYHTQEYQQQ